MVEQQSCAILVNASALCGIEQEVKEESDISAIAEISAELSRERQQNAELLQRISLLETQLQKKRDDDLIAPSNVQVCSCNGEERTIKKMKTQKSETSAEIFKNKCIQLPSQCLSTHSTATLENCSVKWMSNEVHQILECDKLKYKNLLADCDGKDDKDEYINEDLDENGIDHIDIEDTLFVNSHNKQSELLELKKYDSCEIHTSKEDLKGSGSAIMLMQKKSEKVAFCPKEVKRIIELEELLLKNAHAHTIRKIIVFASLGIRHGSEEMYELDINHFTIYQKGEPYLSTKNPGEHVVYENPGVRRKVFYPNRQNPVICPVRILEEEECMRPSDTDCPSCLFLCIKYGGSTRNLPQNEYVRQRMGRNKLKSFGPVICRMGMLANIRSGSFFFKALGITLLFMAGYSDDLVRMETKYKNLDLLQKYYRSDEDAKEETLFLSNPSTCDSQKLSRKTFSTKTKGKKRKILQDSPKLAKKSESTSTPSTSPLPTQFGLMGYTIQAESMTSLQSMPSQSPITYPNFPPQLPNSFVPMMYWPPSNAILQHCYPYTYNYRPFPSMGNYYPQPLYSHAASNPLIPKVVKSMDKNSISNSSSSSTKEPMLK